MGKLNDLSEFAVLLRRFREAKQMSANELARTVGVDPSYITRLERFERDVPRRRVVEAIAVALQLSVEDQDKLLVAGGYAPATVALLGTWDPALENVARVLADRKLNEKQQAAFREVIALISNQWSQNGTS